jgi:predicted nucleic acid-binding protein
MTRFLADASALIALASIGELNVLQAILGTVHTTDVVLAESNREEHPERLAIEDAVALGWLVVVPSKGDPGALRVFGLDRGEASLFQAAQADDVLILDEGNARRYARAKSLKHVGVLGLLVAGARDGRVPESRARRVVDGLARSDFRMTAELYRWAMDAIARR